VDGRTRSGKSGAMIVVFGWSLDNAMNDLQAEAPELLKSFVTVLAQAAIL